MLFFKHWSTISSNKLRSHKQNKESFMEPSVDSAAFFFVEVVDATNLIEWDWHVDDDDDNDDDGVPFLNLPLAAPEVGANEEPSVHDLYVLFKSLYATHPTVVGDFLYELVREVIVAEWNERLEQPLENFVSLTWPLLSRSRESECSLSTMFTLYDTARKMHTGGLSYRWFILSKTMAETIKKLAIRRIARDLALQSQQWQSQVCTQAMSWIAPLIDRELAQVSERRTGPIVVEITDGEVRWMRDMYVVDDRSQFFGTLDEYVRWVNQRLLTVQQTPSESTPFRWHALTTIQDMVVERMLRLVTSRTNNDHRVA